MLASERQIKSPVIPVIKPHCAVGCGMCQAGPIEVMWGRASPLGGTGRPQSDRQTKPSNRFDSLSDSSAGHRTKRLLPPAHGVSCSAPTATGRRWTSVYRVFRVAVSAKMVRVARRPLSVAIRSCARQVRRGSRQHEKPYWDASGSRSVSLTSDDQLPSQLSSSKWSVTGKPGGRVFSSRLSNSIRVA